MYIELKNEIILEINIKENDSKERIINSFENAKKEHTYWVWENIEKKENENEIKDCYISMI